MNEFLWGMVVGGVAAPFAWEGAKWGYRKLREVTGK